MITLQFLIDALASEYEMQMNINWTSYVVSIVLTFGVSIVVGLLVSRKNKNINMVEALKVEE